MRQKEATQLVYRKAARVLQTSLDVGGEWLEVDAEGEERLNEFDQRRMEKAFRRLITDLEKKGGPSEPPAGRDALLSRPRGKHPEADKRPPMQGACGYCGHSHKDHDWQRRCQVCSCMGFEQQRTP